jgi:hypothetical protein
MPQQRLLSADPAAGRLLSGDPSAGLVSASAPAPEQPSALARAGSEFYSKSPIGAAVAAVQGAANVVQHPLDTFFGLRPLAGTVRDLARAQWDEAVKAADAAKRAAGGDALSVSEALGHGLAAILPVLGPAAANVGEHFAAGDTAGGVGGTLGLLTPFAAKYGIEAKQAGTVAPTRGALAAANADRATRLTREAAQQVDQRVLAPGNPKYKGTATTIAPEVLDRGLKGDRLQLQQVAEDGMAKAGSAIDAAVSARSTPLALTPIVQVLNDRIAEFQVGGKTIPTAVGKVEALTQLRNYLGGLAKKSGGVIPFDQLRTIRDEFYDAADKAKGYAMTGGNEHLADIGWASREAGGAIRQAIANEMPDLKVANADYTFFKRLHDVLDPNLGRPKQTNYVPTGVTGGMATAGALIGENALAHLPGGAALGAWLVPKLKAITNSPAWELASAQKKVALADALKAGELGKVKELLMTINELAPRGVSGWAEVPVAAQSTPDSKRR